MPTNKPRVQVTLEPATHEIIDALARLQGRSRGSVIADLIDSIAPPLARTVALLQAASEAPAEVKRGLVNVVEGLHADLIAASGLVSDASKQLDSVLSEGLFPHADPHVVTRGSGSPSPAEQAHSQSPSKPLKPGPLDDD